MHGTRFYRTASFSGRLKAWDEPDSMAHVPAWLQRPRVILARYPGTCSATGKAYSAGARIVRTVTGGWALASEVAL